MERGLVLLNFGEPPTPDRGSVTDYLKRIFLANAELSSTEDAHSETEVAQSLAIARASALLEEYEAIGGSPLAEQSFLQANILSEELANRGYDVSIYVAMQFAEPLIDSVVENLYEDEVDHIIAIPIYPLCGPSTTVAALEELERSIEAIRGWDPTINELTGWHRHPTYNRLRKETTEGYLSDCGIDVDSPTTRFIFSAHGTPKLYLESGSRYVQYVEEYCETMASMLGISNYFVGYQNHENRDIPWTEPSLEDVILGGSSSERIVVDPVSFMHEQSETLFDLDIEMRSIAVERGSEFYRVPIPHDEPRFAAILADLSEPFLSDFDPDYYRLKRCICHNREGTFCLNSPE